MIEAQPSPRAGAVRTTRRERRAELALIGAAGLLAHAIARDSTVKA